LQDFCIYSGVFGDGPVNAANRIFSRATLICHGSKIWDIMG